MPESLAPNLTHWNARLEAALEIIRAAAQRSPAVAEACDIIDEALYYIREGAEPIPRARQSDRSDRSDGSDTAQDCAAPEAREAVRPTADQSPPGATRSDGFDTAQDTAAGRPVPPSDRSDRSDRSDTPPAPCAPAQSAPPAKKICADTLENDFVLGEVETVQEAVEMAVATFGRDAVAEYCGVRPQEIAKAEKGLRVKKVYAAIAPLMPKTWTNSNEEEK